jgi:hypothetical protein
MNRFLPLLALGALVAVACDEVPTEPLTPEGAAVATFDVTVTGDPVGNQDAVFPSTNEYNEANGWAHVVYVDVAVGQVTLDFVSTRAFYSCFEYRIDDAAPPTSNPNPNADVTDGYWEYTCRNNSSAEMTFTAGQYVDIRMAFGAERDERFDWTRFYVLTPPNKDECKNGDWEALGFKNQGQCVRWVETGKDSRTDG